MGAQLQAGGDVIGGGVEVGDQGRVAVAGQVKKNSLQCVDRSEFRAAANAPAGKEYDGSGHASSLRA
jgi:hypothetical protein